MVSIDEPVNIRKLQRSKIANEIIKRSNGFHDINPDYIMAMLSKPTLSGSLTPEGEKKILEVGTINCCGTYAMDVKAILKAIHENELEKTKRSILHLIDFDDEKEREIAREEMKEIFKNE